MEARGAYVRVGLLMLVALALLVGLVLWLGGDQWSQGKRFESYFSESVQGLNVGAPVKYRGVTVGQVTDIGVALTEYPNPTPNLLANPDYRQVYVRYRINVSRMAEVPETKEAIRLGLRSRLATQGLTGLSYLELDFLANPPPPPPSMPWKPWGDVIPSVPSTLSQVQTVAQRLADRLSQLDLEGLVNGLTGLATDLRTQLREGDLDATLVATRDLVITAKQIMVQADLPGTTAALRTLAQGPQTQAAINGAAAATNRLAAAAERLPQLIAALQATARRADSASADLTVRLLPILRDAQATMENLRETTEALRRDPGQALFGAPPPHASGDNK